MNTLSRHRPIALAALAAAVLLLAGCAGKVRGWSQQSYRNPSFTLQNLNEGGLALLPAIILHHPGVPSSERGSANQPAPYTPKNQQEENGLSTSNKIVAGYQVVLDETLLSQLRTRRPQLRLVPSGDVLKMINDAGLTDAYTRFHRDFNSTGIDSKFLASLGKALHCRYVMISRGVISQSRSDSSITFVWSFGRKSTLRSFKISSQVWDTTTGLQEWEGSGVGYNRLSAYEKPPLTEDMAGSAVENLLKSMMP